MDKAKRAMVEAEITEQETGKMRMNFLKQRIDKY